MSWHVETLLTLEAVAHHGGSYLVFAAFTVHMPQVAFNFQELSWQRLLRGWRRWIARSWRGRWGSLRGRRGRISWRRRWLGYRVNFCLVPFGRVSADVWVQHVHVGLNVWNGWLWSTCDVDSSKGELHNNKIIHYWFLICKILFAFLS